MFQPTLFDSGELKALTLWQPYAQAVVRGLKRFETRSWPTRYRGPLAIHAAKRPLDAASRALAERYGLRELPLGAVVAVVEMLDCVEMTADFIAAQEPREIDWGDWRVGRWAWRFGAVEVLPEPIVARGLQGLWTWSRG